MSYNKPSKSSKLGSVNLHRKHNNRQDTTLSIVKVITKIIVFSVALLTGYYHWTHVAGMHESDVFFSHLSTMERELTFRTEMGFYYSYFKQLISSPTIKDGLDSLLRDRKTEYPQCLSTVISTPDDQKTVCNNFSVGLNALERFNLYPELILAIIYRVLSSLNVLPRQCYQVNRDVPQQPLASSIPPAAFDRLMQIGRSDASLTQALGLSSSTILSCVGLGEPEYFYTTVAFLLSSLILIGLTHSGWLLAKSGCTHSSSSNSTEYCITIWGAILPSIAYFANHQQATRVQWTPPLRESFAYPFFVMQQSYLLFLLQPAQMIPIRSISHAFHFMCYLILLTNFQLYWQFAQFCLSTQIVALFTSACGAITITGNEFKSITMPQQGLLVRWTKQIRLLVILHLCAFLFNYALQFGNCLLLQSGYLCLLGGCLVGVIALEHLLINVTTIPSNGKESGGWSLNKLSRCRVTAYFIIPMSLSALVSVLIHHCLIPSSVAYGNAGDDYSDGAHIRDLLALKLSIGSSVKMTFHTMLYVCAPEFDFIGWVTIKELARTGLLLGALLTSLIVIVDVLVKLLTNKPVANAFISQCRLVEKQKEISHTVEVHNNDISGIRSKDNEVEDENKADSIISSLCLNMSSLFVVAQLLFFTIMAVLIMRLKLFWTPQMCLALAIFAQPIRWQQIIDCINWCFDYVIGNRSKASEHVQRRQQHYRYRHSSKPVEEYSAFLFGLFVHTLMVLFASYLCMTGWSNLQQEWNIRGSFSNYYDEVLINWLKSLPQRQSSTPIPWVLTGQMSLLGNLRLMLLPQQSHKQTVEFFFTNHPHYENAQLRYRTILAYSIYSRKSIQEIYRIYHDQLKTNFLIVEANSCVARRGCSNPELYDLLEPDRQNNTALCEQMFTQIQQSGRLPNQFNAYFTLVYMEPVTGRVVLYVNDA